ncbi:OLC1v1023128C1 [Oldenlandia corymbosa var. corymbosa]|uniref:OLC1v1023128C1 n=1 Tax=Oldenlandia corymbosa var. corymbosa TaxID=529605 RepID=A0AAV1C5U5_OLDCO|nr:OLC1v1023128C1 [Oldenlandia corymbosa var. corymbosa]
MWRNRKKGVVLKKPKAKTDLKNNQKHVPNGGKAVGSSSGLIDKEKKSIPVDVVDIPPPIPPESGKQVDGSHSLVENVILPHSVVHEESQRLAKDQIFVSLEIPDDVSSEEEIEEIYAEDPPVRNSHQTLRQASDDGLHMTQELMMNNVVEGSRSDGELDESQGFNTVAIRRGRKTKEEWLEMQKGLEPRRSARLN